MNRTVERLKSKIDIEKIAKRLDADKIVDYWFRTENGDIVFGQKPNAPLIAHSVAKSLELALPKGTLRNCASITADLSLFYWASIEIVDGVNRFRKVMGVATLVGLFASKLGSRK
jgi:hypothetical protein